MKEVKFNSEEIKDQLTTLELLNFINSCVDKFNLNPINEGDYTINLVRVKRTKDTKNKLMETVEIFYNVHSYFEHENINLKFNYKTYKSINGGCSSTTHENISTSDFMVMIAG